MFESRSVVVRIGYLPMMAMASVVVALLAVLGIVQAAYAFCFARSLMSYSAPKLVKDTLPTVSILLSLRGADPTLESGLRQLMGQDYPDYDLRIVVDDEHDPAWKIVQDAISKSGFRQVQVSRLEYRSDRCSLKCAALTQLARELDETTDVVVFADSDLDTHADWLRELVAPLQEEGVGATYGNRWFWPENPWWGSLVRYIWNFVAVIIMSAFKIPWGGSLAIRARLLHDAGLLDQWAYSLVEDIPVRSALDQRGLQLKFVPGLMMINREDCDLRFCLDFIKRQLTWARLYHPRWFVVVMHAVSISAAISFALLLLFTGLAWQDFSLVQFVGLGIVFYVTTLLCSILLIELGMRRIVVQRGGHSQPFQAWAWVKTVIALPLALAIQMTAVMLASFRKTVVWRGVTYRIRGPWDIEMIEYKQYEQSDTADSNISL